MPYLRPKQHPLLVSARGLGAIPDLYQFRLVCKTAEGDYAINDGLGYSLGTDKNAGENTGAPIGLTNSNWRAVFRASV